MTINISIEKTEGVFLLPILAVIYDKEDRSLEIVLAFLSKSLVISFKNKQ